MKFPWEKPSEPKESPTECPRCHVAFFPRITISSIGFANTMSSWGSVLLNPTMCSRCLDETREYREAEHWGKENPNKLVAAMKADVGKDG